MDDARPAPPLPPRVRPLSAVVFLVTAAIAVAGCLATRQVVHDQEHRLLQQRTREAALYLSSALSSLEGQLSAVAAAAALDHESPSDFVAKSQPLLGRPTSFASYALVRTAPSVQVVAAVGAPLDLTLPAPQAAARAAQARAIGTGATVATPVYRLGGAPHLGFAYAAPHLPGYVVYADSQVHAQQQTPVTAGQPFSEIVAAVYAGPKATPDQLVIASAGIGHLPLTGATASAESPVLQGTPWLLVAKARHPLVGSVASATPWALLGAGLLAALLAALVVETLSRRREYAAAVANERTRELQQSLADLAVAHEQLIRQERLAAIGELASTVGHELRNPLGVISNALFLLRNDIDATAEGAPKTAARRHLSAAEREVAAATVIVSDLLEFARQRDPVRSEFDAVDLVDEVLAVLPPPAGVDVVREVAADSLPLTADRDMLRQVLLNLIGNAYQALPDGGTVRVGLADGRPGLRFSVADDGAGIPDDVRQRLFQPFFTTKARGVGLGLAVTKRIVEAHSGTIDVISAPGEGATFVVTMPQVRLPQQAVAGERVAEAQS